MKRIKLVLAVASAMTTMLSLSAGSAGADACFDDFAQTEGRPGVLVSDIARGAAVPSEPGSGTDQLAKGVKIANDAKNAVCPQL